MRLRILGLGAVASVIAMAALVFVAQQGPSDTISGAAEDWGPTELMAMHQHHAVELPPALAFLREIPPSERFDHFRGATLTVTDRDGTPVVIQFTPGTVTAVSPASVTIVPNGETATRTFELTSDTLVRALPARGSLQAVVRGDQVVVVTVDESAEAAVVLKHPRAAGAAPRPPTVPTPTTPTASPMPDQ